MEDFCQIGRMAAGQWETSSRGRVEFAGIKLDPRKWVSRKCHQAVARRGKPADVGEPHSGK